jgi:hypothetical protein
MTFEATATVQMVNQEFRCRTRNLSPNGLALTGHKSPVPAGTFMRVQFKLPKQTHIIDLDGVLVQTNPGSSGVVWGLKFIEPRASARERIEKYLDTRLPERHHIPHQPISERAPEVLPRADTRPAHPSSEHSKRPPSSPPDPRFIQMYEEAMLKASLKRKVTLVKKDVRPKVEAGTAARLSREQNQYGGTTGLDAELRWLYEQATAKAESR